jgi:hypothetical protein
MLAAVAVAVTMLVERKVQAAPAVAVRVAKALVAWRELQTLAVALAVAGVVRVAAGPVEMVAPA